MRKTSDTLEDDIREISLETISSQPEWLTQRWAKGESPGQIARETGHTVDTIYAILKEMQKAIIGENGH